MWTRLKPPSLRRCGAPYRSSHYGLASERFVRVPASVKSSPASLRTYYDVLGVEANASVDDIKSAFRRQAKLVHPDVSKSADSEEEFKQLKEAYDVLSDADQRAEYDEAVRRAQLQRSSRTASSSRRVVIIEDDPWGVGDTTVEVVLEGVDDSDDDDDDDDSDGDGFLAELEYMAWAAAPGNMRSSFQSSWQANARKQQRRAQQQQQKAAMQAQLSTEDKVVLLREMPPQARAAAQQVFGARLQTLNTLEELAEVMEAVAEMGAMGIEFEYINEGGGRRSGTRGSQQRRQGSSNAKARQRRQSSSNGAGSGSSGGSEGGGGARRTGVGGGGSLGSRRRRM